MVLDAGHGVQAQTMTVWTQAARYNVARICLLNKMDRKDVDHNFALQSIRDRSVVAINDDHSLERAHNYIG